MATPAPASREGLYETSRMCQAHNSVLATQTDVLNKLEAQAQKNDAPQHLKDLQGRLKDLLLHHKSLLGTVSEKEKILKQTISQWEDYRCKVAQMQSWLLSLEQEKQGLQLRQVPQKRLQKVIDRLKHLIQQLTQGEEQVEEVSNLCQQQLLTSCDSSIHPVLKAELGSLQQRVKNLHAGLQTWLLYLQRCAELWGSFQDSFNNLQEILAKHQSQVSEELPKDFPLIQERIACYQEAITDLESLASDLTQLRTLREEMVESLTPADSRLVTQRMWRVTQLQAELIHEYKMKINTLEDQLESWELYETKYTNFIKWTKDMEEKIVDGSEQYIDTLVRKLEYDYIKEINSKTIEKLWLTTEGEKLISCSNANQVAEITEKMETIKDTWSNLNDICNSRRQKLQDIINTISKAEITLTDLKDWLFAVEKKLSSPVIFLYKTKREIDRLLETEEELRREIENQSTTILSALDLCNTVICDCKEFDADGDTDSIQEVHSNLELRWISIKTRSDERKTFIKKTGKMWDELESIHKPFVQWLMSVENRVAGVNATAAFLSYADLSQTAAHIYQLQKDIHDHTLNYEKLNQKYRLLARPYGKDNRLDQENEIREMVKSANSRFHKVSHQVTIVLRRLRYSAKLYEEFDTKREYLTIWLTELTKQLTKYEHEYCREPQKNISTQLNLAIEYEKRQDELSLFENLITLLYKRSCYDDCSNIEESLKDYWNMQSLLYVHLNTLQDESSLSIAQKLSEKEELTDIIAELEQSKNGAAFPTENNATNSDVIEEDSCDFYRKSVKEELTTALTETTGILQQLEDTINIPIPKDNDDYVAENDYQALSKQIAKCQSSVDLLVSLSESASDDEDDQQLLPEVACITRRFRQLECQAQAKQAILKERSASSSSSPPTSQTCALCSQNNWNQFENDLTHLEQWLIQAQVTLAARSGPPDDMAQIELAAQTHREFLMEVECHKAVIASLNTVGSHFAQHTSDISRRLTVKERLNTINSRWEAVCNASSAWQTKLYLALMGNTEFQKTITDLLAWTESADTTLQDMSLEDVRDDSRIKECTTKVIEVQTEVERCHPRVAVLYESSQYLLASDELNSKVSDSIDSNSNNITESTKSTVMSSNNIAVRRQLQLLDGRLQHLSLLCKNKLKQISQKTGKSLHEILAMLDLHGASSSLKSSADFALVHHSPLSITSNKKLEKEHCKNGNMVNIATTNTTPEKRGWWNFICRVMRAALPIYAFMLLMWIFMFLLVPTSEDRMSCSMANTFARSLDPMLRYTNGPPPF
ncbi:unnamed protein product [Meganyctiphanes norvegica]|uniref:KASH domain-containing protein n=1 Tax=Meganyctiphanes norvegica TaxID=48144 RepID=A0AAV2SI13_MEGNR